MKDIMGMYNFLTQNYIGPHTKYCYLVHLYYATNINLTIMLCNVNFILSFLSIILIKIKNSQLIKKIKVKTMIFVTKVIY